MTRRWNARFVTAWAHPLAASWVAAGAAVMLAAGIVWSWPGIQDDALIHLRYADVLLRTHKISYDGQTASFGNSSLLYLLLLAALRTLIKTALLPRLISSIAHGLLFVGAARILWQRMRAARALRPWGCLLLLVLALPSAVRWLDDGMETPLTLIAAALLAMAAVRRWHWGWYVLLGAACVMLRVEMLVAVGLGAGLQVFATADRTQIPFGNDKSKSQGLALCAGAVGGIGMIVAMTGHVLPDTAIAKSLGAQAWAGTLLASAEVFASALGFGAGLLLLWLLTTGAIMRRRPWVQVLTANALFPIALLGAALRGQMIQGIRYFAWTLMFSIAWNLLSIAKEESETNITEAWTSGPLRSAAASLAVLLAVGAVGEAVLLAHVFRTRSRLFVQLQSQHLERLSDLRTTAMDVGYIGYFTGAPICDLAGLVNGRAAARLAPDERTKRCVADRPQVVFLNAFQMGGFAYHEDVSRWSVCGVYDFSNLHTLDLHYLAAAPEVAGRVCAVTGKAPSPLEKMP